MMMMMMMISNCSRSAASGRNNYMLSDRCKGPRTL